jgi:REP element-mobilizing transposase RayT
MTSERYRITDDAHVYFVTYSIVEWLPVFVSEHACRIVTDSLNFCHEKKHLRTNAFVIMPTHMHAIVFDAAFDNERLQRSLADFRKFTGRSLSDYCAGHTPKCFLETLRASSTADRERRFWQPSRHPEAIQTERFWTQKLDYLHENPCRKGLVTRAAFWRFSSAAYYVSDAQEACDVVISAIDWT